MCVCACLFVWMRQFMFLQRAFRRDALSDCDYDCDCSSSSSTEKKTNWNVPQLSDAARSNATLHRTRTYTFVGFARPYFAALLLLQPPQLPRRPWQCAHAAAFAFYSAFLLFFLAMISLCVCVCVCGFAWAHFHACVNNRNISAPLPEKMPKNLAEKKLSLFFFLIY